MRTTKAISHSGQDIGDENVSLTSNVPDHDSPVITWTVPDNYDRITYDGSKHNIYTVLRTKETFNGTASDDTQYTTNVDLVAPGGETVAQDMPYQPARVFNVTQGTSINVLGYDFRNNMVYLETDPADGDEIAVFPVVSTGSYKFEAQDLFGNRAGTGTRFGQNLRNFTETKQNKEGQKVRYPSEITVETGEGLSVLVDSPHDIVWEDNHYIWGDTASEFEIDVTVQH